MKQFYHAFLLYTLALPSLATELESLEKEPKGKGRLTISQEEERTTSSEDEERGFSSKVESSSESSEEEQEKSLNESDSEVEDSHLGQASSSTSWTGDHLPLNLRVAAHEFYKLWQPISRKFEGNTYADFINQVVEKDGIGINRPTLEEEDIDYNRLSQSSKEHPLDWKIFLASAGEIFDAPKMLDNPFADYFKGVFAYFGFLREESELSTQQTYRKAAKLLNYSSKNYYIRATSFMLEMDLGHLLRLEKEELTTRENMHLRPLEVIKDYVNRMSYPRLAKTESIDTLEYLIGILPGHTEDYQTTYKQWVDELTFLLKSSKSISSGWVQNLSTLTLTTFAASVLIASAGNSLNSWAENDTEVSGIVGITQAGSGITSVLVGGVSIPWIRNFWSSLRFRNNEGNFQWRPTKVSLLDNNLTLAQITDSARLVILYGFLYNINHIKNGIDLKSDRSKKYIKKLHDLILSSEYQPTEALSSVILKKEPKEFKY